MLIPGKLQVYNGSSATLNWNYSQSSALISVQLRFKGVLVVNVLPTGQAGPVNASFQPRFSVSSTPRSVSLLISEVTTVEDKSNGEFSCELNDLAGALWRRAIQVQVVGKLKSFSDVLEILTTNNYNIILSSFRPLGPVKVLVDFWKTRMILHAKTFNIPFNKFI